MFHSRRTLQGLLPHLHIPGRRQLAIEEKQTLQKYGEDLRWNGG